MTQWPLKFRDLCRAYRNCNFPLITVIDLFQHCQKLLCITAISRNLGCNFCKLKANKS